MHARLVVPTDDLFAWTLTGRGSLLTHPDDDPRTAVSRDRFALRHLLATGHHVTALGHTVIGNLLGALGPEELPTDTEELHARVARNWTDTAQARRALVGTPLVPDEDCDRRAVDTLVDVVPATTLTTLLRWAAANWRAHRQAWPTHLVHAPEGVGRFGAHAHLLRVITPQTALTGAQRAVVRACQDAGLDVLHLRVNSFGALPSPTAADLGLTPDPGPGCPSCPPALAVGPATHLLPGERPLPPVLHPGTGTTIDPTADEEPHDHHLRAHLDATETVVSEAVAALTPEALQREAFTLLTHPDTARDSHRARLERATRRHQDLTGDPHLAHEQAHHTRTLRAALTRWHTHENDPTTDATTRRAALRHAATAAGEHLALHGHDVLALRQATGAVNRILAAPRTEQNAPALFRMLSLGITGDELLQMDATGTYPDLDTLELLAALRS